MGFFSLEETLVYQVQKLSKRLSSLRDWLLPMLMNGQVTIREEK